MRLRHCFAHQTLACLLACATTLISIEGASAASTDIADLPLPAAKRPNPNLVLAIDDSGSTDNEVSFNTSDGAAWFNTVDGRFHGRNNTDAIDFVAKPFGGIGSMNFNATGNESTGTIFKKYIYLFPNGMCGPDCDTRSYGDEPERHYAIAPTAQFATFRANQFNRQYYDPAMHYLPWKPYNDGTAKCPAGVAAGTGTTYLCTPSNANPKAARSHPIYGTTVVDLTVDTPQNATTDYFFRMFPGMIVPSGAKYRICSSKDNKTCGAWNTSSGNSCLINGTVTTCAGMGMSVTGFPIGVSDHADVQIAYYPASYYVVDNSLATPDAYAADGSKLKLIQIKDGKSYAKVATRDDCAGTVCTYAEEIQNFANWYQYYRKRHMSMSGAIGNAFDGVRNLRGGYVRFSDNQNPTMYDFDKTTPDTDEHRLLGLIYRIKGKGGTPTRETMDFIGQYYMLKTGAITDACQFNAQFIITDGFASTGGATGYNNFDGVAPSAAYPYNKQFSPTGAVITSPYADKWSNTMADIAMKYYTTNLRPDLKAGQVPVDKNDQTPNADKNPNLHLNTYGLILGLRGEMFGNPAFAAQQANPFLNTPDWNAGDPTTAFRSPKAIDELWHATINGRGQMLEADSPEETRNAILDVVNHVVAKGGAGAAVAVSNPNPVAGDNFSYASNYNAGAWSGDVNKYSIDLTNGQPSTTALWVPSPQKQLAARNLSTNPRIIATYDGALGQPFSWATLLTTQQAQLGNDKEQLDYLRGDRSREGTKFRSRGPRPPYENGIPDDIAVLGDIVNAEPAYVGAPRASYLDTGYASYKATNASRTKVVYQGANDGMLHAFDEKTGAELWAYIPKLLFPTLSNLASKDTFIHKFYVDGTPATGDIDISRVVGSPSSGSGTWRTILVGGLGKGGRGYYALDVTSPTVTNETALAGKVLWEFPNNATAAYAANVGNTFAKPIIVKTRAAGWVVMVTSGYNNGADTGGNGQGHLFVLNPVNGNVIADIITTGVGTSADPSGLAYISAYVNNSDKDNTTDAVYGGDLKGNVWRFDFSGSTVASWTARKLAALVDSNGLAQPITTEPELSVVDHTRMVYVGTGQYLGNTDIPGVTGAKPSATGVQTMYGLRDDMSAAPLITPLRSNLVEQKMTKSASSATLTSNKVDLSAKKGWFIDLPETGERIVTHPAIVVGVLEFTTNIPDGTDPCLPGGSSWIYAVDYANGGNFPKAKDSPTVGSKLSAAALASRAVLIKLPTGKVLGMVRLSDDSTQVVQVPQSASSGVGRRKSWREIVVH